MRVRQRGRVAIGGATRVGRHVRVDVARGARLILGEGAQLGDGCRLEVHGGTVEIGAGAVLGDGCAVACRVGVLIGAGCLLEDEVVIMDSGPRFDDVEVAIRLQGLAAAPVRIEPGALLGPRAVVLPGVRVGAGARVGARAVVERDVPAGGFVEGVPARPPGGPGRREAGSSLPRGRRSSRR
jgi:acetyltransferase-like isoleucine patch superfamily enzyme